MEDTTQLVSQVNRYYHDTAWDYKYLWVSKALAVHFGYYDKTTTRHNAALLKMNEMLAEKANIQRGEKIIDAGCGIGGSAIWLAKNKGCEVTGINIVEQQLNEATQNAKNAGVGSAITFLNANYTHLPFQNSSYDVFWALESLVHASDKEAVIQEAWRILKNHGRIVIAEYMLRENPVLNQDENKFLTPWLYGWSMPSLLTASMYEQYLKAVGCMGIQKFDISKNVAPSLQRLKLLCQLHLPGARLMEWLGLFTRQRVANIEGSLRQIDAFEKGYWRYIVMVGTKNS